jgi:hypothetical protein
MGKRPMEEDFEQSIKLVNKKMEKLEMTPLSRVDFIKIKKLLVAGLEPKRWTMVHVAEVTKLLPHLLKDVKPITEASSTQALKKGTEPKTPRREIARLVGPAAHDELRLLAEQVKVLMPGCCSSFQVIEQGGKYIWKTQLQVEEETTL